MEDGHLVWEILLKPLVLLHIVLDELYRQLTVYLYGALSLLPAVEPCLGPPVYPVLVGIDADGALDVEALDVDVEILKRVYDTLARYGVVSSFFFSISLIEERKMPCIRAR